MVSDNILRQNGGTRPRRNDNRSLATRIVEKLTARENVSVEDLDPIYQHIDPDALDDLFASRTDGSDRPNGRVVFPYNGYKVTVFSNGEIETIPLDTEGE